MGDSEWFVNRETYEREVEHPTTKEKRKVRFRPLNAGDRAEFNEIRLQQGDDGDQEGSIRLGRVQLLAVERAVVDWDLPQPKTIDTIAALDPRVFDQLYKHVSFGNPAAEPDADDTVDGNARPLAVAAGGS